MELSKTLKSKEKYQLGIGMDTSFWYFLPSINYYNCYDEWGSRLIGIEWLCFGLYSSVYKRNKRKRPKSFVKYLFCVGAFVSLISVCPDEWEFLPTFLFQRKGQVVWRFEFTWFWFTIGMAMC